MNKFFKGFKIKIEKKSKKEEEMIRENSIPQQFHVLEVCKYDNNGAFF